jgi:hypothetical protein
MIKKISNENSIIYYSLNRYRDYLKNLLVTGNDALEYTEILDLLKSTEEVLEKYRKLIQEKGEY